MGAEASKLIGVECHASNRRLGYNLPLAEMVAEMSLPETQPLRKATLRERMISDVIVDHGPQPDFAA
jgi:hypothetical protein